MMTKCKASIVTLSILGMMVAVSAQADDDEVAEIQAISQSAGLLSVQNASEEALVAKPGTIVETDID